ncbi:MAG: hypothetical protein ACLSG5_10670 [Oscillospiraceae bacterium]
MGIPLNVDWQQILLPVQLHYPFRRTLAAALQAGEELHGKARAYYKDMDKAAAEKLAAAENEQQKYSDLSGRLRTKPQSEEEGYGGRRRRCEGSP